MVPMPGSSVVYAVYLIAFARLVVFLTADYLIEDQRTAFITALKRRGDQRKIENAAKISHHQWLNLSAADQVATRNDLTMIGARHDRELHDATVRELSRLGPPAGNLAEITPGRSALGDGHDKLAYLFLCPWCLSIWLAIPAAPIIYAYGHNWWLFVPALALALSAAAGALARVKG